MRWAVLPARGSPEDRRPKVEGRKKAEARRPNPSAATQSEARAVSNGYYLPGSTLGGALAETRLAAHSGFRPSAFGFRIYCPPVVATTAQPVGRRQ